MTKAKILTLIMHVKQKQSETFNYELNRQRLTLVIYSFRKEVRRRYKESSNAMRGSKLVSSPERIKEMTYRLICSQNFIPEQDSYIIDWENDFVCKYEMRERKVRQNS